MLKDDCVIIMLLALAVFIEEFVKCSSSQMCPVMTAWIFTRTQVGPQTAAQQHITRNSEEVQNVKRSRVILHARYGISHLLML